jgi:DNA-binding winged helix-turn-helix (wHTH) protein
VEKETLLQSVWPDVAVEEGNLNKGIFSVIVSLQGESERCTGNRAGSDGVMAA